MSKAPSARITISGLDETVAALHSLEPEVLKRMQKELKAIGMRVAAEASSHAPAGHPLAYTVRQRSRGRSGPSMRVSAKDKYSAMFEFAGTRMRAADRVSPITPQGAAMVRWLEGFGKPGRFLWAAWDQHKDAFEADIKRVIGEAEQEVQAHLNAAGETW